MGRITTVPKVNMAKAVGHFLVLKRAQERKAKRAQERKEKKNDMTELTGDEAIALIDDVLGPLEVARSDGRIVCIKRGTQDDNPHQPGTDLYVHWRDGFASASLCDANDQGYFHAVSKNADKSINPFLPDTSSAIAWNTGFDQGTRDRQGEDHSWKFDTDYGDLSVGINPSFYETTERVARATHKALCSICETMGMDPAKELFIKNPAEASDHSNGRVNSWWVCWESGPVEWAVSASLNMPTSPWGYCETNWGYDLIFEEKS